ncbi:hypothetical protein [Jannaschia sp. M317]|uniref:hypothetical protein n=1 Tax=Jannaschia sp. M317 TaxID=2867011 RepID=UPI0021A7A538|nr:hypothetical protein [Jannaschia sp. M317]UWQ18444.1 hypothetical protein K3551_03835 [Jannaschia sp. M317]
MSRLPLEDFGKPRPIPVPEIATMPVDTEEFDAAYNAGWDDAMAQVDSEQGRIGEKLGDRLVTLERDQKAAISSAIAALEPMLHEVFDKLLPRAAERSFLAILLDEIRDLMAAEAGKLLIQVAPEEAPELGRLLDRANISPERVTVRAEPALALSQALVRWDDQERRIDLEAVLSALDDALESFLASIEQEPSDG